MRNAKTNYQVIWVSPREFANEGNYVFGSEADLDSFCDNFDYTTGTVSTISNHRTKATASEKAELLARRDRKMTPSHEICNIDAVDVADMR